MIQAPVIQEGCRGFAVSAERPANAAGTRQRIRLQPITNCKESWRYSEIIRIFVSQKYMRYERTDDTRY